MEVPGQLAKYQQAVKRPQSRVYFFGPEPPKHRYEQILGLMEAANIQMFSFDAEDEVKEHSRQLSEEDSIFADFKQAQLRKEAGRVLNITEAKTAFCQWATANQKGQPANVKNFLELHLGPLSDKPSHDSLLQKSIRGWKGWCLVLTPNTAEVVEPASHIVGTVSS